MNVLITGATGFLGGALLARIGVLDRYKKIYLLTRPGKGNQSATHRIEELIQKLFAPRFHQMIAEKIETIEGELTAENLGMSAAVRTRLIEDLDQIIHVGANTKFSAPLQELRSINVDGTKMLLELAAECKLKGRFKRFDYVSTSFVAGKNAGVVNEGSLLGKRDFANAYEQTKYEGEVLAREFRDKFPITVFRPSVIVGHSECGYTPHFRVMYWPLKLLAKKVIPIIPIGEKACLDVVPIDYVVDAMEAVILDDTLVGQTYLLTAGIGSEVRISELVRDTHHIARVSWRPIVSFKTFDAVKASPLRFFLGREFWKWVEIGLPYRTYIEGHGTFFNNEKTRIILKAKGIECPRWSNYKQAIFEYCRETNWGTVSLQPEHYYYTEVLSSNGLAPATA